MHGHYAGRKFQVVVNLLDSIAANFRFVEALEISHCDGKPLNFVIGEVDGEKITKAIDFDASAVYGKNFPSTSPNPVLSLPCSLLVHIHGPSLDSTHCFIPPCFCVQVLLVI